VAHGPDPAAKESLAALLGALITDAKDLLVRELRLAQLEVRQEARTTKRVALALGGGSGVALAGGLLLLVMVVYLLAAVTELPLWGGYGLLGGGIDLAGALLVTRGKSRLRAGTVDSPRQEEPANGQVPRRSTPPDVEPQRRRTTVPPARRTAQPGGRTPPLNASALWGLLKATFTEWNEDKPFQLAAALSYRDPI
jgi:hypothetical protein